MIVPVKGPKLFENHASVCTYICTWNCPCGTGTFVCSKQIQCTRDSKTDNLLYTGTLYVVQAHTCIHIPLYGHNGGDEAPNQFNKLAGVHVY